MRIPRVHTAQPLQAGTRVALEEGPSRHLGAVLRLQPGDPVEVFDGCGSAYPATIAAVGKRCVELALGERLQGSVESPLRTELGIGISKGERMDWVVQKATELGATRISPLVTLRTEVRLAGEREQKKLEHWRQIAISACEQSGRNQLPEIAPPQELGAWLAGVEADSKRVLHPFGAQPLAAGERPASVALLVGPEGGLSEAEVQQACAAGFIATALGPRILRTETAPVAILGVVQYLWGDWQ